MVDLSAQFAFGQGGLLPQEEVLEVRKKSKQFVVGIPKETDKKEADKKDSDKKDSAGRGNYSATRNCRVEGGKCWN